MVTTQSTNNDRIKTFLCSPGSTHYHFLKPYSKTLLRITFEAKTENFESIWLKPPCDVPLTTKSFLVNLSCKWTPISLQGEHFLTTIFWIPDESTLQVRIRIIENLLAVILIPITIQTEEFAILSVTKKISKKLDKGEKQSLDLLLNFIHTNLGALH